MNEIDLRKHLKPFNKGGNCSKYLLEVETANTYSGIRLSDRSLAFMLCKTAKKSGVTKYIRLFFFPDSKPEKILYESRAMR